MNILLTTHQFFPQYAAGTEILTCSVAKELIRRGHVVHVYAGHPSQVDLKEDDRFDEYDFEGIHVYRFHHAHTPMAGQLSLIELGYDNQLAAHFFEKILIKFKPDLVHFFHLNRLGTGLIEKTVCANIAAFLTPTDFWVICPTGQLMFDDGSLCAGPNLHAGNCVKHLAQHKTNGLARSMIKLLPTIAVDSIVRLTRAGILSKYPYQREVNAVGTRLIKNIARLNQLRKIVSPNSFMTSKLLQYGVLPNLIVESAFGVDTSEVVTVNLHQFTRKPFRIGFIGSIANHKGCHVLIEAFKNLPNGQALLKIYGNMDELPDYAYQLRKLSDSHHGIEFCGTFHNSEISEVLASFDVLVVPSLWYENTPLVLYSAQAARCPVIASNLPGISEVIRDQVNGLLFEVGNVSALTKQLSRLIEDPKLLGEFSANCKQPKSIAAYVDELLSIWDAELV